MLARYHLVQRGEVQKQQAEAADIAALDAAKQKQAEALQQAEKRAAELAACKKALAETAVKASAVTTMPAIAHKKKERYLKNFAFPFSETIGSMQNQSTGICRSCFQVHEGKLGRARGHGIDD